MTISVDIAAPIERVWKAVTDEKEIPRWFAPVARVKPGLGGSIFLSWGPGMEGEAPIVAWAAPHRFAWREETTTVEFVLESASATTRLSVTQSGNPSPSNIHAWQTFFAMLKYGLETYPNEPAVNVARLRQLDLPREQALLLAPAFPGTTVAAPAPGYCCQTVDGVDHSLLAYFIESGGGAVTISIEWILYGPARAYAAQAADRLDHFLNSSFATDSR
ncbi:MAG: SRPBCC domain-containing protein [Bryobacteraceae bacterium]